MHRARLIPQILVLSVILFGAGPAFAASSYYTQPTCTISITNYRPGAVGNESTATLNWSSVNADRGTISGIGAVGTNGVYTLMYPKTNMSYTLTVYGNGGSATCSTVDGPKVLSQNPTYGYGSNYPYYTTPYVTLTQIPYTGIEWGTMVGAVYASLVATLVLAAGYLAFYFRRTIVG